MLVQVPQETFDAFWEDYNVVVKLSFEVCGTVGVAWSPENAVDVDFVIWGTVRRLHMHPGSDGNLVVSLQEAAAPVGPANAGHRPRGHGPPPGERDFLHGGIDRPDFFRYARLRSSAQLAGPDSRIQWWPRSPFDVDVQQADIVSI